MAFQCVHTYSFKEEEVCRGLYRPHT